MDLAPPHATSAAHPIVVAPALARHPTVPSPSVPCVVVSAREITLFAEVIPGDVALFGVVEVDDRAITAIDRHGETYAITYPLMLCLGFLVVDEVFLDRIDQARRLMEQWSGLELPVPARLSADQLKGGISVLLATTLVSRLSDYAAHSTRLSRELFRLRAAHEEMLNAFAMVESFVGSANIQPCQLAFESLPEADETLRCEGISQLLPVSTRGLSIIQIHVADWKGGAGHTGGLAVELRSVEDREVHQSWEIPFADLRVGWTTFCLAQGLVGVQRTPQLIIRPLGGIGQLPPLSLGALQPLADFRPRATDGTGGERAGRSLALRCWNGIPGVRPPNLTIASEGRSRVEDVAVPFSYFGDVRNISENWKPEFQPVATIPEIRGLLCHPPPRGATWGELSDFPAGPSTFRLAVRALVRNPRSQPTEFALAFAAGAEDSLRRQIHAGGEIVEEPGLVFSGWRLVTHAEPALLSITVPAGLGARGSVFFGARIADDRNNSFAWASFTDLRKTTLRDAQADAAAMALCDAQAEAAAPAYAMPAAAAAAARAESPAAPVVAVPARAQAASFMPGLDAPLAWLTTAESAFDNTPAPLRAHYDYDRRGIICHPPMTGVALAHLDAIPIRERLLLSARAHIGSDRSKDVEFCMAVSPLPAHEVLAALEGDGDTDGLTWSGWVASPYGHDQMLKVDTEALNCEAARVYLATRMLNQVGGNDFAWAFFMDLRIASLSPASRPPGTAA